MKRLDPHSAWFTVLLGALVTLASFATDMGLPVLADTARSLGVTAATAALSLSVFMAGFAIGPLIIAPMSDRYGRRPLLLAGCAAFAMFGALGASAQSLRALLLWRFLMGAGAGTAQVLVLATVRDLFQGAEARAKQSYVNLAAGMAPIVAPTLGVWIASVGGWRSIYAALAGGGVILCALSAVLLAETAPRDVTSKLTLRATVRNYARAMRHPVTIGNTLVMGLSFGCLFAYVSSSSLVLVGLMGVSRRSYGILFALTALGLTFGALCNARANQRAISHRKLIFVGLSTIALLAFVLLVCAALSVLTPALLIGLVIISHIGQGISRPNVAQGALEPMADIAGVASALLTGTQMVFGATASAVAAALFDGRTAVGMTLTMVVCSWGALALYMFVVRPAEKRMLVSMHRTDEMELAVLAEGAVIG